MPHADGDARDRALRHGGRARRPAAEVARRGAGLAPPRPRPPARPAASSARTAAACRSRSASSRRRRGRRAPFPPRERTLRHRRAASSRAGCYGSAGAPRQLGLDVRDVDAGDREQDVEVVEDVGRLLGEPAVARGRRDSRLDALLGDLARGARPPLVEQAGYEPSGRSLARSATAARARARSRTRRRCGRPGPRLSP